MKPYLFVLALLPLLAHADDKAAANLVALLGKVNSMSADFSQTIKGNKTISFAGGTTGNMTGSMTMARPNKFRWEVKKPDSQLIVVNGDTAWIYDKDLPQIIRQSSKDRLGESPTLLLSSNPAQIAKNFEIVQSSGKNHFVLTPKVATSFKRLEVSFNGGRPVMLVLNDNEGQTVSTRFSNVVLNPKVAASQFVFTPPQGVDIVEQ